VGTYQPEINVSLRKLEPDVKKTKFRLFSQIYKPCREDHGTWR
jgi:hypothetical protein